MDENEAGAAYRKRFFTGDTIYGYWLDKPGWMNKRNKEVNNIVVDENAAKIIQLIFHKYVHEGFDVQRLCRYLAEMNIRKPKEDNFLNASIIIAVIAATA